ncbi:MAG: hypothetical protein AB1698_01705 [Pseudomonadota bacterium]
MDEDALFDEVMAEMDAETASSAAEAPAQGSEGGLLHTIRTSIPDPLEMAASIGGGIWKAAFETADTFTGEPAEEDKSGLRRQVEGTQRQLGAANAMNSVTGSVAQFAAGMVGLGKLLKAGQALRVGGALLAPASKIGKVALESAKAATVGAVAFDPWEERLSNLVEQYPSLSNPVTRYLAADPNDSAAEGRLKSVVESLGMDVALLGAFKAFKLLKAGDREAAVTALDEVKLPSTEAPTEAAPNISAVTDSPLPQDNRPSVALGAPANDAGDGGMAVAQGNAARAVDPPTSYPPAQDARQSDVGVRQGGEGEAPEAANSNVFTDDYEPGDPYAPSNDNRSFTEAFEESTRKVEPQGAPMPGAMVEGADDGAPTITRVDNVKQGLGGPAPKGPKVMEVAEPEDLLSAVSKDADALDTYGSREAAEEAGHKFAPDGSIPWQKLNTPEDLSAFLARSAKAMAPELDAAKGGAVLSDARLQRLVGQRLRAYGDNPADVLTLIEGAGTNARTLAANMEAADAVAVKLSDEAYRVAEKIQNGLLDEWGGDRAAAVAEFAKRTGLAMTTFGHARSMLSNAGRTLRRGRGDLERLSFSDIQKLKDIPAEQLLGIIQQTKGDAKRLREVLNKPSILAQLRDAGSYLLVNNLLWGWKTHVVNLTTNAYMLAARPGEKWLGSLAQGAAGSVIRKRAAYEYRAMASTLVDAFQSAAEAVRLNDSIMDPHRIEAMTTSAPGAEVFPWRPVKNVGDLAYNGLSAAWQAFGLPTRLLGGVDEAVKQIRYRSVVLADAQMEADSLALTGQARKDFVEGRLASAFDADGRAINTRALQEARIATFQQELLPGTPERGVQTFVSNHPTMRFVLPFVKTPANVLRYGIKYSPGLNMLQAEFREAITGKVGQEAQAQAAGQLSLGLLFVAAAATLVADGRFTGSGPKDHKQRASLVAAGWQPNSVVWVDDNGKTNYFPLGRFDPIGLPFGIIANLMDIMQHEDKVEEGEAGVTALGIAIAKQITDRTYLQSLTQFFQALSDPERSMGNFVNNLAGNMVPMSSGLKAYVNDDPYMREVRDVVDGMVSRLPGYSKGLPVRYDAYGDPMLVRKGLSSTVEDVVVDNEMIRMGTEFGKGVVVPPSPTKEGHDLRDLTLESGRTAYETLQEYAGHPAKGPSLKQSLAKVITSKAYAKAPDGEATTPGTKQWMLSGVTRTYRDAAEKRLQAESPIYREAMLENTMKVRAAYTSKATEAPDKGAMNSLRTLGAAFGVSF